jgi:iron(III) transport system substrate-binding protein
MKHLIALIAALLLVAGCTGKESKVLQIYTSLDSEEAPVYIKKFEEKSGIQVKFVRMSAGEVLARLEAEKNNPQVSVWFGGPSPEFMVAKDKGLLASFQPNIDFKMDDAYHDGEWKWTGFYFGAIGFASNEKFFKDKGLKPPESWDDLLNPALKGHISLAFPYTSGTAYTVVASLLQKLGEERGWDYIKKLDKQVHHYNKSGSAAVTQAGLGEVAVGISFSHDILKKGKASGYPVTLTLPKDGTGSEIGAMAMVKGAKQEELAKEFMNYMISAEGQGLLQQFYRVPLNPKASVPDGAITAAKANLIEYNPAKAATDQKKILEQWRKVTAR